MFLLRIYANFPELNLKAPLLEDLEVEMKVSNITHFCVCVRFSVCIPVYIRVYVFLHAFMTHGCIDPCMLCALLIQPSISLWCIWNYISSSQRLDLILCWLYQILIYLLISDLDMQMQELKRQHPLDRQQVISENHTKQDEVFGSQGGDKVQNAFLNNQQY